MQAWDGGIREIIITSSAVNFIILLSLLNITVPFLAAQNLYCRGNTSGHNLVCPAVVLLIKVLH